MALFAYRAVDAEGRISTGNLDASNAIDLELRLKRLGLDLLTFEGVKRSTAARTRNVSREELITFCFHLSQLLKAGVNIIEALTDLRDTVDNPGFRQVIALDELSENLKWQDEMASQAKKALVYPALVFVVIIGVIFVLMIVLVPQLAATFKTLVPKLPRETEVLIFISNIFVRWWYLLLGIPAALVAGALAFARTNERAQRAIDEIGLKMPILGQVRQKIILARFSTYFALLYKAGISVLDCIQICEKIVGNRVMEEGLQRVGRSISEGQGISAAFAATKLFPPLVLRMLRVGESTGGLDTALRNVSYFYNRQVRDSISRMQTLLGPATTVVLGMLIVAILYSIFLPIYDVISKIKF